MRGSKRVIVTGARGFVGRSTILPLLNRGYEVHAIVSSCGSTIPQDVTGHCIDLLDAKAVASALATIQASHLLHTAWDVTHGLYWTSPANVAWREASKHMLMAFRDCGGQRAVGLGTCAEYEWRGDAAYDEVRTSLKPATPYGVSKLELCNYMVRASSENFSTAWARIFNPYGPREKPQRFIPSVIRNLLRGLPVEMTKGTQIRDFLYIDDLGDALAALLDSPVSGAVNVASGQGVPLRQIAEKIVNTVGLGDLVQYGALPDRDGEPEILVANIDRLIKEVGFHPRIDLETGLAASIAFWLAETNSHPKKS